MIFRDYSNLQTGYGGLETFKESKQCHSLLHEAPTICGVGDPCCSGCRDYLLPCPGPSGSAGPARPEGSFPQHWGEGPTSWHKAPVCPTPHRGAVSQKGPVPCLRLILPQPGLRPVVGGTLLHRHWAERPRFPVPPPLRSSHSLSRRVYPGPTPWIPGLQPLLPASRMGNRQQELKHRQLLLEELGGGAICPWILESPVSGHLPKAQLAPGDEGGRAGRGGRLT